MALAQKLSVAGASEIQKNATVDKIPETLVGYFRDLLRVIQLAVDECKARNDPPPETFMYAKMATLSSQTTETGITQTSAKEEQVAKPVWFKATSRVLEKIKNDPAYIRFGSEFLTITNGETSINLEYATQILVGMTLNGEPIPPDETLTLLIKAARRKGVSVWSEIDVFGLALKTKSLPLMLGQSKIRFRQLELADFEYEYLPGFYSARERFNARPASILRIDTEISEETERDAIEQQLLTLLRLVCVCSVDFGQRAHGVNGPFPFIGRLLLGGTTMYSGILHGRHRLALDSTALSALQTFFDHVAPTLARLLGDKRDIPLSIAYERYCDSLFSAPVERKIASCIMGLEALYFDRNEIQELGYRLSLRVAKVMSKTGAVSAKVQQQVKTAYGIRSIHVHGSYLSGSERKKKEAALGLSLDELAAKLLNYLRITLVHLLCSMQNKTDFLKLVEAAFLDRALDDQLLTLIDGERDVLRGIAN